MVAAACGKTTRPQALASWSTPTATSTTASGSWTSATVRPSVRPFHRPLTLTYPTLSYCAGWGKFTSSETGSVYEGFWKDGVKVSAPPHLRCADLTRPTPLQDGTGTMFLSNGDSFSGSWEQGVIKGAVVYKFGDKSPWNDPEY